MFHLAVIMMCRVTSFISTEWVESESKVSDISSGDGGVGKEDKPLIVALALSLVPPYFLTKEACRYKTPL